MDTRHSSSWKALDLLLVLVSLLVLLPCVYYSYVSAFPDLGFTLSSTDWKVVSAPPCLGPAETCLEVGDQVISIRGTNFQDFVHDRRLSVPGLFDAKGIAPIRFLRGGKTFERAIRLRAMRADLSTLIYAMFAPLVFWLMGSVVIIFLRPRDERWLVLILFSYNTALWIASGFAARTAGAAFLFHVAIWFSLPLSLHLH